MTLYKVEFEGCHGGFSPEVKAEALADMRENCFEYKPSQLLSDAEMFGILSDLLDFSSAKDLDKQKIDYISSCYSLLTQIENFIREDDKDKFAVFLYANHKLIHDFPTNEIFSLLCWNNATACVTALLESPLRVDIDVNSFGISVATVPLEVAVFKLSVPLTKTLLAHGADANAQHGFHTTILDSALAKYSALATLRSHNKRVSEWTVNDFILTLFHPDMKEALHVTTFLASHTKNVESVLSLLIDVRKFTEMTILLVVAFKKLLVPPDDKWTFKNAPVAKYISQELKQIQFEHADIAKIIKKTNLNDACTVAKFVWESCNSCLFKGAASASSKNIFKDAASASSKNIFKVQVIPDVKAYENEEAETRIIERHTWFKIRV